ncbi:MAG TPA: hypothetical protein VNA25_29620 [Phycisphaerae bacterium]|nr:hypothetical protein [Phycisphaerae bacterium]
MGVTSVEVSGKEVAADPSFAVEVLDESVTVLAANAFRRAATIINWTDKFVWLALGDTAVVGEGIPLAARTDATHPGGSYTIGADNLYLGIITAIGEAGAVGNVVGAEL